MEKSAAEKSVLTGRAGGPCENAGSFFYLRIPDACTVGAGAGIGEKAGLLGGVAAGPVFLHVGTASVEPTEGQTYDPTDGATTDPYPAVPACASAAVPERANAVASTIVLRFMAVSFSCRSRPRTPPREKFGTSVPVFGLRG